MKKIMLVACFFVTGFFVVAQNSARVVNVTAEKLAKDYEHKDKGDELYLNKRLFVMGSVVNSGYGFLELKTATSKKIKCQFTNTGLQQAQKDCIVSLYGTCEGKIAMGVKLTACQLVGDCKEEQ